MSNTNPSSPPQFTALAERCEQATGRDRTLEQDIHDAIFGRDYLENPHQTDGSRIRPYTTSLDAAMTLLDEDWFFHVSRFSPESIPRGQAHVYPNRGLGDDYECEDAATPALALCAAALRARGS